MPEATDPTAQVIRASLGHRLADAIWLAVVAVLLLPNALVLPIAVLDPNPTPDQQSVIGFAALAIVAIALVGPFLLARRSRLEVAVSGLRLVRVLGESRTYGWADVAEFSVVETRPLWLLGLARRAAVAMRLASGETVELGPTEHPRPDDAIAIRDMLAARRARSTQHAIAPALPRVYRPTRVDRILASFWTLLGAILLLALFAALILPTASRAVAGSSGGGADQASAPVIGPLIGALGWLLFVGLYLASRRERLVVSAAGLELVPYLQRSRRFAWPEIRAFDVATIHPHPGGYYGAAAWSTVVLELEDGRIVPLAPTERSGAHAPAVLHTRDELAAALQSMRGRSGQSLDASATGTAMGSAATTAGAPSGPRSLPRRAAVWDVARAWLALAIELALFAVLELAAGGSIVGAVQGATSLVVGPIYASQLLLLAATFGLAAFPIEASLRRGQPAAQAYAARPVVERRATTGLPVHAYAPAVATLELAVLLVTLVGLIALPFSAPAGDTFAVAVSIGAIAVWLAYSGLLLRAIVTMVRFRSTPVAAASEAQVL